MPSAEDVTLRLEDYVLDYLPEMVRAVQATSGARELSLLGYCLGGLLTLLYAASHPQAPLRALLTLATPVDFAHLGLQGLWARHLDPDRLVATYGNIPAALIQQSFRMLKPASELSVARMIGLWQHLDDDRYVAQFRAFDRWTNDHIDFPGETFRQVLKELVQGNKLVKGEFTLGGRQVDLGAIRCPFLAIAAEADHIVPLAAARPQPELVGSVDKALLVLPGGHVGLAAGRSARHVLWPRVVEWRGARAGWPPPRSPRPRSPPRPHPRLPGWLPISHRQGVVMELVAPRKRVAAPASVAAHRPSTPGSTRDDRVHRPHHERRLWCWTLSSAPAASPAAAVALSVRDRPHDRRRRSPATPRGRPVPRSRTSACRPGARPAPRLARRHARPQPGAQGPTAPAGTAGSAAASPARR